MGLRIIDKAPISSIEFLISNHFGHRKQRVVYTSSFWQSFHFADVLDNGVGRAQIELDAGAVPSGQADAAESCVFLTADNFVHVGLYRMQSRGGKRIKYRYMKLLQGGRQLSHVIPPFRNFSAKHHQNSGASVSCMKCMHHIIYNLTVIPIRQE